MIGSEKLSTIRKKLRSSFKKTDAEMLAWFNQQMEESHREPQTAETAIENLRLLRDALLQEANPKKAKQKRARAS